MLLLHTPFSSRPSSYYSSVRESSLWTPCSTAGSPLYPEKRSLRWLGDQAFAAKSFVGSACCEQCSRVSKSSLYSYRSSPPLGPLGLARIKCLLPLSLAAPTSTSP